MEVGEEGDYPGLPFPNEPGGFCGREATLKRPEATDVAVGVPA